MRSNSPTKNLVYLGSLAILLLIAFTILFLYYTQPFKEEFILKDSIDFGDIDYTLTTDYNNVQVLSHANIRIGTLKLENQGYFLQKYHFPNIFGCIKFSTDVQDAQKQINIIFNGLDGKSSGSSRFYENTILEIPIKEKLDYNITAEYSAYGKSIDYFKANRPTSLYIYEIPTKERNPLGDIENYNYGNYLDCNNINSQKPLKVIQIN